MFIEDKDTVVSEFITNAKKSIIPFIDKHEKFTTVIIANEYESVKSDRDLDNIFNNLHRFLIRWTAKSTFNVKLEGLKEISNGFKLNFMVSDSYSIRMGLNAWKDELIIEFR